VAETVIEDGGNGVHSRWCWWWPTGGGLDGGRWLWKPGTAAVFSSSSPCRGASLWFPSLFSSVSSFFVGSRVFSAASDVLPSLPLLRGGAGGGGLPSFSTMRLFFSSVLPCFPFFLLFLTVVLLAGKTMAAGGDDEVLCSWCCCCYSSPGVAAAGLEEMMRALAALVRLLVLLPLLGWRRK